MSFENLDKTESLSERFQGVVDNLGGLFKAQGDKLRQTIGDLSCDRRTCCVALTALILAKTAFTPGLLEAGITAGDLIGSLGFGGVDLNVGLDNFDVDSVLAQGQAVENPIVIENNMSGYHSMKVAAEVPLPPHPADQKGIPIVNLAEQGANPHPAQADAEEIFGGSGSGDNGHGRINETLDVKNTLPVAEKLPSIDDSGSETIIPASADQLDRDVQNPDGSNDGGDSKNIDGDLGSGKNVDAHHIESGHDKTRVDLSGAHKGGREAVELGSRTGADSVGGKIQDTSGKAGRDLAKNIFNKKS